MFIFAVTFNLFMIGPWSLLGFGTILLYYPILVSCHVTVFMAAIIFWYLSFL